MSFELQGYGYEFDTKHYGGPFDGSDSSVISFKETPPIIVFYPVEIKGQEFFKEETSLGKKLLNKWKEPHYPDETRVAVYKLEGDPQEYNDEDIIPYHFQEITSFAEYKQKYKDKRWY